MTGRKIGRNEPCPCGSGYKYKHCCGAVVEGQRRSPRVERNEGWILPAEIWRAIAEQDRKERERVAKYGSVRSPVSIEHMGHRIVAVGNTLYWSSKWKTFYDFLGDYVKFVISSDWGNAELKKPYKKRHVLLRWYHDVCMYQRETIRTPGEVTVATATGPVIAYYSLAYDLYTLQHHSKLQKRLINRLKNPDQFQGVRYEIYVAATFVRGGFDIAMEDEKKGSTTHCEFIATHRATGFKYSVEAKSRHRPGLLGYPGEPQPWERISPDVGTLIRRALAKAAEYERIIFVDLNMPPEETDAFKVSWLEGLSEVIDKLQAELVDHERAVTAFIFFTNHPHHYVGNEVPEPRRHFLMTGFNIEGSKPPDPSALVKYPAIAELFNSVVSHTEIPHEFE